MQAVAVDTGFSEKDVEKIIVATFQNIIKSLQNDYDVILRNIGRFKVYTTKTKKARNLRTGREIIVPPRKKIKFIPAVKFRKDIGK